MRQLILVAALAAALSGCTSIPSRLQDLEPGMTKAEVIRVMGKPDSSAMVGTTQILTYISHPFGFGDTRSWYFVRLQQGKVEMFGEKGDFGSTLPPTHKIVTDEHVTVQQTVRQTSLPPPDAEPAESN